MIVERRLVVVVAFAFVALVGCGPAAKPEPEVLPSSNGAAKVSSPATPPNTAHPEPTHTTAVEADAETPEQIFARVKGDLLACFVNGKKATPAMTSGKITLNAAIDSAGKASCVVPSDDTGLTQEVEDCMRARMGRETFKSNGASWATEIPIVINNNALTLGPPATTAPAIETIETHGLPDSANEVVESLLPALHECVHAADVASRVVHVGARIGKDGRVECALASAATPVPAKMRECTAGVLAGAKFPAPRSSVGLISVPVRIVASR